MLKTLLESNRNDSDEKDTQASATEFAALHGIVWNQEP
jgi:hypothetical protein